MINTLGEFKDSAALSLGVELELQLVSLRDFDLTRGATDLLGSLDYDERFGEIKLEITESMIEISTWRGRPSMALPPTSAGYATPCAIIASVTTSGFVVVARIHSTAGRNGASALATGSPTCISATATWPSNSPYSASTSMSAAPRLTKRSG